MFRFQRIWVLSEPADGWGTQKDQGEDTDKEPLVPDEKVESPEIDQQEKLVKEVASKETIESRNTGNGPHEEEHTTVVQTNSNTRI